MAIFIVTFRFTIAKQEENHVDGVAKVRLFFL